MECRRGLSEVAPANRSLDQTLVVDGAGPRGDRVTAIEKRFLDEEPWVVPHQIGDDGFLIRPLLSSGVDHIVATRIGATLAIGEMP
jgi:hypothetical protein